MATTGSCLCGAVRYEVKGAFKAMGHCHCSICRKSHGAAFATWAMVDPETFRWTAGVDSIARYASSPTRERCFCKTCGSPLVASHSGNVMEVVVATVDGDPGLRPHEHIFVGSKARWYEITDALPQNDTWPPGMEP